MRVKIQQFLFGGTLFSWAIVGQNIGRAFLKAGHDVEFISTDGVQDKYVPDDLKAHVRPIPTGTYDCQVSYTAAHNFPHYLRYGSKNRFGIWNYDGTEIPPNMIKFHKNCDKMLPSSDYARNIFLKNGVPADKLVTVPHGINLDEFVTKEKWPLKTKKTIKILLNIASPHRRKNLRNTLRAFGRAFTKDDDVCLVVKVNLKKRKDKAEGRFFVDFSDEMRRFKREFKNHAEAEVVSGFIPDLVTLYNACDIVYMLSNLECWWLPGTEAFAAGKMVVASRHGGHLHYVNDDNSLLVDGKLVRMPKTYQYWIPSVFAEMFEPDVDDGAAKLRYAVENYDALMDKFAPKMAEAVQRFTWDNVAKQIEGLCEN